MKVKFIMSPVFLPTGAQKLCNCSIHCAKLHECMKLSHPASLSSHCSYIHQHVALTSGSSSLPSTVSSSSLQKKSCGANYSHKWSPAVEYKAWNLDFQCSLHQKGSEGLLTPSIHLTSSLEVICCYIPDFLHLSMHTSAGAGQWSAPHTHFPGIYISTKTPPLSNWKRRELLQSQVWCVMFIERQPQ